MDLLGHPLAVPSPELQRALALPNLATLCAAARLMNLLSPGMRSDGETGGWTRLMDGIPALFPLGFDNSLRGAIAALAGLIDDPMLPLLKVERPSEDEIRAEMKRLAKDAAKRFETAAEWLRQLGGSSHE